MLIVLLQLLTTVIYEPLPITERHFCSTLPLDLVRTTGGRYYFTTNNLIPLNILNELRFRVPKHHLV